MAETCQRLKLKVVAWVNNITGESFAPPDAAILDVNRLSSDLLQHEFVVPLFTPRHRRAAVMEPRECGFSQATTLIDPTAVVASSSSLGPGSYVNTLANVGAASRIGAF